MAFRLERTTDANGVSERIVDDHGVIALVKARGKAVDAGPVLAAAPEMLEALKLAYRAMNYFGDVLNGMGAVMPEDEDKTTPAFQAVRAILTKTEGNLDAFR